MASCTMSLKLLVVVFATVLIASSSCDFYCEGELALSVYNPDVCSYYFDLLENALLNDSSNLYRLQLAFFPSSGNTPREVGIVVFITVGEIVSNGSCDDYCDKGPLSFSEAPAGDLYSSIQLRWKKPDDVSVRLSSNLAVMATFESVLFFGHAIDDVNSVDLSLELQLDKLPCNPCSDFTYDTVAHILTWAKAYARAHGKPEKLDESDGGEIGTVSYTYDAWDFTNNFLLAGFIFLNVLVMLLMVRFVPDYYIRFVSRVNDIDDVNTRDVYLSLYWGCTVVLFFLAMALCLLDIVLYIVIVPVFFWASHTGITVTAVFCISTKFVVMVVELIVCVFVQVRKRNTTAVDTPTTFQMSTENVLQVFCCCCCRCTCCSSALKSKVVQTLALWGIMVVVQHITASLIPLCFLIILQPAEVLSALALAASTLFCIIMLVAHFLHRRIHRVAGRLQRIAFYMQLSAIVSFIGLAIVSLVVYLSYLKDGVEFSGLGSFLGSLAPSIILSAVGWYIKKRFLDTKTPADPNLTQPGTTEITFWYSDSERRPLLRHVN